MARPIAPTPKLNAKATERFLEKIEREKNKPIGKIATPRVDNIIKRIMSDANTNRRKE